MVAVGLTQPLDERLHWHWTTGCDGHAHDAVFWIPIIPTSAGPSYTKPELGIAGVTNPIQKQS